MREYRFWQVDVFTGRAFGGNPLAVFPEADGLSNEEMRAIAREMNLSETTFVFPPGRPGADFRVRIFTPAVELPFAGHPVVGTHWVLAHIGRIRLQAPVTQVQSELGVGVLPVDLHVRDGRVVRVVMTQGRPTFGQTLDDVRGLAAGLGLPEEALTEAGLPVQVVSTGTPQLMVPVRSLLDVQSIDTARLDASLLGQVCRAAGIHLLLVFSLETEDPRSTVHARAFAPLIGIPEDPATGSANGALGAYLVRHRVVPLSAPTVRIQSEQGREIGRPSLLHLEVDHEGDVPATVRVGGEVVPVIEGVLRF